jgi:hypothetical protein
MKIPGLGVAGASGLLAVLRPGYFGTVDQYVVRALRDVPIPEALDITEMNPESLTGLDGALLIRVLRRKAAELTNSFGVPWTPREVDMALWAVR